MDGTGGLVVERRVGGGRIVVTRFPLTDVRIKQWKNFDGFFNAVLLRRPARVFSNQIELATLRHAAGTTRTCRTCCSSRAWARRSAISAAISAFEDDKWADDVVHRRRRPTSRRSRVPDSPARADRGMSQCARVWQSRVRRGFGMPAGYEASAGYLANPSGHRRLAFLRLRQPRLPTTGTSKPANEPSPDPIGVAAWNDEGRPRKPPANR